MRSEVELVMSCLLDDTATRQSGAEFFVLWSLRPTGRLRAFTLPKLRRAVLVVTQWKQYTV
eukprot:COSAG01_NODE_4664_length_4838_cov_5.744461_6_plen_60_part_01